MKIPIVDENDNLIGYKDIKERGPEDICRVAALWLRDAKGNVLLARRSVNSSKSPGLWGPAVAGTLENEETYESNIIKEAKEEIGLTGLKPIPGPKIRRSTSHEYFCQWFTAKVDRDYMFKKKDEEVEEIRWFTKDEIPELFENKPEIFLESFGDYINYFIK